MTTKGERLIAELKARSEKLMSEYVFTCAPPEIVNYNVTFDPSDLSFTPADLLDVIRRDFEMTMRQHQRDEFMRVTSRDIVWSPAMLGEGDEK